MFENLLLLAWYDILLIVGGSIGICMGIILLMDIWLNNEWTPVVKAVKFKNVKIGVDDNGDDVYQRVEYPAIVDWGTMRSVVSGVLLGIFYSISALIGVGELVVATDVLGDITNIWTVRIVPLVLSVFVGFFSNTFWKLIYWIGSLIEKKIEQRKEAANENAKEPVTQAPSTIDEIEEKLEAKIEEKVEQVVKEITPPPEQPTQTVQELLEETPVENQI